LTLSGQIEEVVAEVGETIRAVVGEKQSTWRRWNLHAEASRQPIPRGLPQQDTEPDVSGFVGPALGIR